MTQQPPDAEAMKAFNSDIVEEFRANDGKVGGPFTDADLLLLTTTGVKSGHPRLTPLAYLRINGKLIIVGSYAGSDADPAWVGNLRANPQAHIEIGVRCDRPRAAGCRARCDFLEGHSRGTTVRRLPGEDGPGDPVVRAVSDGQHQSRLVIGETYPVSQGKQTP